ncbi:MAG: hypothetical protein HY822_19315 [Acidobacteria bacterium]|nr:hypothetical protein [Acidobacteriota bacterium]
MPDIFSRVASVDLGDLNGKITGVVSAMGAVRTSLNTLRSPQESMNTLMAGLGNLAPPNVNLPAEFTAAIGGLRDAVPTDLTSVTGELTAVLGNFSVDIDATLVVRVQTFKKGIEALHTLTQIDFSAVPPGDPSGDAEDDAPAPPTPAEQRLAAIRQIDEALGPAVPLDVPGVLGLAQRTLSALPRQVVNVSRLPFLDDLIYTLSTVTALREMDAPALREHFRKTMEELAAFLSAGAGQPVAGLASQLTALASKLDAAALKTEAESLRQALAQIGAKLDAGQTDSADADIQRAQNALATLLPRLEALNANLFDGQTDATARAFQRLPLDLDRQIRRAVHVVKPADQAALFQAIGDRLKAAIDAATPEALAQDLEEMLGQLVAALDRVNLVSVRGPMLEAVDALKLAAEKLDELMAQAGAKTAVLFEQVDKLLDKVPTTTVIEDINRAIGDFSKGLEEQVGKLIEPARKAIEEAVGELKTVTDKIDAKAAIEALRTVIAGLAGALDAPEVKSALNAIRETIDGITAQLKTLSFTPVTDQVVAAIDEITAALKSIDTSQLSTALKLALNGAVMVLPKNLDEPSNLLLAQVDPIAGPAQPLLQKVEGAPARLLGEVRKYSPAALVAGQLSKPYQDLLAELDKFRPSQLLAPVQKALDGLKEELKKKANPAQLLAPLEALFQQVLAAFDKLQPAELIKPLEEGISQAVAKVLDVLPVDEFLKLVDDIVAKLKSVLDVVAAVKSVLEKTGRVLTGLADPEAQLRAWLAPTLARAGQMADAAGLQPSFDKVSAAVNALKAAALRAALDGPLQPLKTAIGGLGPGPLLAGLAAAFGSIRRDKVLAMADSPRKTALIDLLDRANPVNARFARPFEGLERWLESLQSAQTEFGKLLEHWDARYHGSGGPLAGFVRPAVTAADLKTILGDALENEVIKPLGHLLGIFSTLAGAVQKPLAQVTAFADEFEEKANDLLLCPDVLAQIGAALKTLVDKLKGVNLQFLVEQLNTVFATVKGKLEAVGPAAIRAAVDEAFQKALDQLDTSKLLPKKTLDDLDASYTKVIDTLKGLDPEKLIVDVVQPEFEKKIVPMLKAFDITALIQALIERLEGLKGELKIELDRANVAYQEMLKAVPPLDLGIGLDIDIGVSLGF